MIEIFIRWVFLTGAVIIVSYMMDGISVSGFFPAFFAAAVLGILNAFLRPILIILTLPINMLSFGLFTFVVNAFMLQMASGIISGFEVRGFWSAVFGSILISFFNWLLNSFIIEHGSVKYVDIKYRRGNRWE
ncbi:MAG: phage holin family protein [Deltaproteobacteria bacterium]|nr:phage holin family protein [Deltaproteobacteria bacterium]MBW2011359.1 phage holin family protein [Deltaproteobacteria bacterium]MBW2100585.1 phage holin family protein [Deltaproteobacteria bacterium]